jgi:hypothetical protein
MHSRNTNVALWSTGKVGMKRMKNMCRHSSKNIEVRDVASTAAVTFEDYKSHELGTKLVDLERAREDVPEP